jgi:uncharacterized paraquat-inducible protein A
VSSTKQDTTEAKVVICKKCGMRVWLPTLRRNGCPVCRDIENQTR